MTRKTKLTNKQRIKAVEEYLKGEGSYGSIARKYGIGKTTFRNYVRRARSEGIDVLRIGSGCKKYSKATKLSAVKDYLAGKGSLYAICTKYKISDTKLLRTWIK